MKRQAVAELVAADVGGATVSRARGRICGGGDAVTRGGPAVSAAPASQGLARAMTTQTWRR